MILASCGDPSPPATPTRAAVAEPTATPTPTTVAAEPPAYYNRGFAYGDLGQQERAIEDYDEAIRLNPQFANPYAGRALAYTLLGDDTKAQQDADRAVEKGINARVMRKLIEDLKKKLR